MDDVNLLSRREPFVALTEPRRPAPRAALLSMHSIQRLIVLGCGTLIGHPKWGAQLEAVCARFRRHRSPVRGPVSTRTSGPRATTGGLVRVLSNALEIGVRGPRSHAALGDAGLRSVACGDTAFLHPLDGTVPRFTGFVGVNVRTVAGAEIVSATSLRRLAITQCS